MATIGLPPANLRLDVNTATNRLFAMGAMGDSLWKIDAGTNRVVASKFLGYEAYPLDIQVDSARDRTYVSFYTDKVSAFAGSTFAQIGASAPTGREPTSLAVNPVTRRAYTANYYSSSNVTVIQD